MRLEEIARNSFALWVRRSLKRCYMAAVRATLQFRELDDVRRELAVFHSTKSLLLWFRVIG